MCSTSQTPRDNDDFGYCSAREMRRKLKQTQAARKARAYYRKNRTKILRNKKRRAKKLGGNLHSDAFKQARARLLKNKTQTREQQIASAKRFINSSQLKNIVARGNAMRAGAQARTEMIKRQGFQKV